MLKLAVLIGVLFVTAATGCYHAAVSTGAPPARSDAAAASTSATPIYLVDGIMVFGDPGGVSAVPAPTADQTPLYIIDGVMVTPLPSEASPRP
jgi:hypothetical protein